MQSEVTTANDAASQVIWELTAQMAAMKQELESVKCEVQALRDKCSDMNKTLISLCCPKEWFTEEIDEKDLRKHWRTACGRADRYRSAAGDGVAKLFP